MFALVTGGSGSGKSEFAENLAVSLGGEKTYIAAMMPSDSECIKRIERHRQMRSGKGFKTIERYTGIKELDIGGTVILECLSNLTANEMYSPSGAGERAAEEITEGILRLNKRCENLIVVTNEIFSDGADYGSETEKYMKTLGKINVAAAKMADEVYEVVYTIVNRLK